MEYTLGQVLKNQREIKGLSLRQVELLTKVSNAYLSQLENDKIKNPSVNIIYKLSDFYNLEFNILLEVAGIAKKKENSKERSLSSFALSSANLTEGEEDELLKYLKFLRSQDGK